jgi:ubiquinone/menaquinone biosynthesis C-methylase UbiE
MTSDEYKRRLGVTFNNRLDYNKDNFHGRLADKVVALASPKAGDSVLDIATGTGLAAIPSARLVGKGGKVVGVDISQGMLDRARIAIASAGLENVELVAADAEMLDYPASSFDIVLCASALPYMTDVPSALRSWHGLMKPGGRLAFNCWSEGSYITGHMIRAVATRHGIKMPVTGEETGTPDRCRSVLTDAGFVDPEVLIESSGHFITMEQVGKAWDGWIKNPIFHPRNPDDAERLTHLRDEYLAEAQRRAVDGGVWDEMTAYFVVGTKPIDM